MQGLCEAPATHFADAFRRFEAAWKERTARVQETSRANHVAQGEGQTPTGSTPTTPGPRRSRRDCSIGSELLPPASPLPKGEVDLR